MECNEEILKSLRNEIGNLRAIESLGNGMWSYRFSMEEASVASPVERADGLEKYADQQNEPWIEIGYAFDRDVGSARIFVHGQSGQLARLTHIMGYGERFVLMRCTFAEAVAETKRRDERIERWLNKTQNDDKIESADDSEETLEIIKICEGSADNPFSAIESTIRPS